MCGMFGYNVKKWEPKLANLMALLAVFNETRGKDAFGWTNGRTITKDAFPITNKFNEIPFEGELISAFHTRAGTSGPKNGQECAHPWSMTDKYDVIGMHNGFIANHTELNKEYHRNFPVDSMQVVAHLAAGLSLTDVQFSGVFIYFENRKGPFFFRTTSRDLDIAMLTTGGIVWSSDFQHLRRAIAMAKLEIKHTYKIAETNQLYELNRDGMTKHDVRVPTMDMPAIKKQQEDSVVKYFHDMGYPHYDKEEKKIETFNKPTPKPENFKRVSNIGQWRRIFGDDEQSWVVCYHRGALKTQSFPHRFSCGCFENDKYHNAWPTMWRPLGEWKEKIWYDCWHFNNSSICQCRPFDKRKTAKEQKQNLPVVQVGGNVDDIGDPAKIVKLIGPAS